MEGENEVQNMSFDSIGSMQSIESSQSNLISEISAMSLEDDFEDILESSEEPETQVEWCQIGYQSVINRISD